MTTSNSWTLAAKLRELPGGKHTLLYGPPGTGKTTLAEAIADKLGTTSYAITCHQRLTPEELIARPWVSEGTCTYEMGPALLAWIHGTILRLDEADDCGEEALQSLRVILGGPNERLTLPDGTTHAPKLDERGNVAMRCFATSNRGPGDLPAALRDRFPYRIPILTPSDSAIDELPEVLRQPVVRAYMAIGWSVDNCDAAPMLTYREAAAYAVALDSGLEDDSASELVWQDRAESVRDHIAACNAKGATR